MTLPMKTGVFLITDGAHRQHASAGWAACQAGLAERVRLVGTELTVAALPRPFPAYADEIWALAVELATPMPTPWSAPIRMAYAGGQLGLRRDRTDSQGEDTRALCLVHAGTSRPGQPRDRLRLFNNVALAAITALMSSGRPRLIVDWDVHHGNGTQHLWEDPRVGFSIHRFPTREPAGDETGGGGARHDQPPRPFGISQADYASSAMRRSLCRESDPK